MSRGAETPLRPLSNGSRAEKTRAMRAAKKADLRNGARLQYINFVANFPKGILLAHRALCAAINAGHLPRYVFRRMPGNPEGLPSVRAVGRWRREYLGERVDLATASSRYCRDGRPKTVLAPEVRVLIDEQIALGVQSITAVWRLCQRACAQLGVPAPTKYLVGERMRAAGHLARVVGAHGRRAGLADAVVHGAVPAPFPHAVWTLDELQLPVWTQVYSHHDGGYVAVKPYVCLVVDGYSGVIVNAHLINPLAGDKKKSYTSAHVAATMAGALFKELALPVCQPFAGWVPHVVRLDRHATHDELRAKLLGCGVQVPNLPGQTPYSRGLVEGTVRILKSKCAGLKGHDERWLVAELAAEEQRDTLRATATTGERIPVRTPITVRQLLTMTELEQQLSTIVQEINERDIHSEFRVPRGVRLHEALDTDRLSLGESILEFLEPKILTVTKDGIPVAHRRFPGATGEVAFAVNDKVMLRVDPLYRGIWAEGPDHRWHFLPPKREYAATLDAGRVAHAQHAEVSAYESVSREARRASQEAHLGAEGAEYANVVAAQAAAEARPRKTKSNQKPAAARAAVTVSAADGAGRVLPFQRPLSSSPLASPRPTPRLRGMRVTARVHGA